MSDNSSSGLRHLKKNHKIDKDGQRQTSQTTVILRLSDFSIWGFGKSPYTPPYQISVKRRAIPNLPSTFS
jgi:hypothetical protein